MKKKSVRNSHIPVIPILSFFLLLLAIGLLIFQLSKAPKEVKAVAGDIKIGVGTAGAGCAAGEIIMGGGTAVKSSCGSFETAFASKTPQFAGLSVTGTVTAPTFSGALSGNATTATSLSGNSGKTGRESRLYRSDAESSYGYYIRHYWTANSNGWRITASNDVGDEQGNIHRVSVDQADYAASAGSAPANGGSATYASYQNATGNSNDWVQSFQQTPAHATSFREMSGGGPSGTWWFVQNFRHSNGSNYWGRQIAWGWEDNANEMYTRNIQGNNFGGWVRMINSANIGSQSVNYANSVNCGNSLCWNSWNYGNYYQTNGDIYMGWAGNWLSTVLAGKSGTGHGHDYATHMSYGTNVVDYARRLWRSDGGDPYNVQTYWTGSRWRLRGYYGDSYHAEAEVAYADSAGSAPANGGSATYAQYATNNILYFPSGGNISYTSAGSYVAFGVGSGYVSATSTGWAGGSSAWQAWSDQRLKKNIDTIDSPLSIIKQLRGVRFNWNGLGGKIDTTSLQSGFIAQEVEKVLPSSVGEMKGYKSFATGDIIPFLVEGMKEQQTQIVSLQSITTDFISKFREGLIETKKLIVDGVDILKKLNELSDKSDKQQQTIDSQQKQIDNLKKTVEELKK